VIGASTKRQVSKNWLFGHKVLIVYLGENYTHGNCHVFSLYSVLFPEMLINAWEGKYI
jgi:hypothetical protein